MLILAVTIIAFVNAQLSACTSSYSNCKACLADATCGWCDLSTSTMISGGCFPASNLATYCATGAPYNSSGTCPNHCSSQSTVVANICEIPSGSVVQSPTSCKEVNNPTTNSSSSPSSCDAELKADGLDCAAAVVKFGCSYTCQACSDGGNPLPLCASVCQTVASACPTYANCSGLLSSAYTCAPSNSTTCVSVTIEGALPSISGAPATGTSSSSTASGATSAGATLTSSGGATASSGGGAINCTAMTTCTTCAQQSACKYCSSAMTKNINPLGTCVAATASCPFFMSATTTTSPALCVYDLNNVCSATTTCTACNALPATSLCGWCNPAGIVGASVGASCEYVNGTGKCQLGESTTAAAKCEAPHSIALATITLVVALLATML